MGGRVEIAINHVGGEDMFGERVRIAEEVGEGDGGKRVAGREVSQLGRVRSGDRGTNS